MLIRNGANMETVDGVSIHPTGMSGFDTIRLGSDTEAEVHICVHCLRGIQGTKPDSC